MPRRALRIAHYVLCFTYCVFLLIACTPSLPQSVTPLPPLGLVTRDPNATSTPTPFLPPLPSATPSPSTWLGTSPSTQPEASPAPTVSPSPTLPSPTPTATFTPAPAPVSPTAPAAPARTTYTFFVTLDYPARSLSVDETIRYTNPGVEVLTDLVLAVEPNDWPNCFYLESLRVDGASADYSLDGHHLRVILPQPLPSGGTATLAIYYRLDIPPKRFEGTFGYLGYQLNLTDWYPFVVPYIPGQGWLLHDAWTFGEHLVYEAADFEVNLKASSAQVIVAASAPGEPNGEWTRYRLEGARTFALSASEGYLVTESAVGSVVIRSYYFAGHEGAGERIASAAAQALAIFQAKFGPYPYPSLSIVATEVPDGREFDGLVFLSTKFYDEYEGGVRNNLVSIGVHEIAHQWWFGLVGSDQALEPWLDEALATYSERIFYEFYGSETWWWNFRVNYFKPAGWVDTDIYHGGGFRPYTNAVYLRGAKFLEDLRARIGDEAFFAFLQDYAARHARGRATGDDFFAVLREHTDRDFSDIVGVYFQGR